MTNKEKLLKLRKLANAMYYAAQHLTIDAARLHKAMEDYHQFITTEYHKEEPVSEDLEEAAKTYAKKESHGYEPCNIVETFKAGAQWQKQQDIKFGYITALQGEKQFARYILEMIANGWHIEAIKTACNDKIKEDEQ